MSFVRPRVRLHALLVGLGAPILVGALAFACTTTPSTPAAEVETGDARSETGATVGSTEVRQSGRAAVVQANTPVVGATVSAGGNKVVTDAEGRYTVIVPRGKPIQMRVTAPEHYQLIEQEYVVDTDPYERGDSLVLTKQTANLLSAFLKGYDATRGLLAIRVVPMRGCASEGGTVLTLDPPGAEIRYTEGGLPGTGTSLSAGANNGALFYNVATGVPVTVTATSPKCEQLSFPVTYEGVKYTGTQRTEAGESFSFMRVFLGPKSTPDAGAVDASNDAAPNEDAASDAGSD
jgi:hypothetical protein